MTSKKQRAVDSHVRLSDPGMKAALDLRIQKLAKDNKYALKFLQEMGIATPTGRLSKHYR